MVAYRNQTRTLMPSITIKDIPRHVHLRLKERARRNRRSLQQEILLTLEQSVTSSRVAPEEWLAETRNLRKQAGRGLSPAQIDRARRDGRP